MKTLLEARQELDEFLWKKPHMQEQQNRIQEILGNTHPDKRFEVLFIMMSAKLSEQIKQLNGLQKLLTDLQKLGD